MISNNFCPDDCPVDCSAALLEVPDLSGCEEVNNEQITEIFWSNQPLATGDLTEWNNRLSQDSDDPDAIRSLNVMANLPRAEAAFKTSRLGTRIPLESDREISYTMENDSDAVFAFLKGFECGVTKKFWFRSGRHIYGGLSGINATMLSNYEINSESELMAHNWQLSIGFKSKCFPPRTLAVV